MMKDGFLVPSPHKAVTVYEAEMVEPLAFAIPARSAGNQEDEQTEDKG